MRIVRIPSMRVMAIQNSSILGHDQSGRLGRLAIDLDHAFVAQNRRVGQVRIRANCESTTIGDASQPQMRRWLWQKRLLGEITKGSLRGFPLGYLISADRHQPDLTIASGSRTRRWRSHPTLGGSSRISVCQTLTARPPQTLLGKHLLSR